MDPGTSEGPGGPDTAGGEGTMSTRPLPVPAILTAGLGMGVAGDLLLRTSGGPGLNFTLLFLGLAGSVAFVSVRGGSRLSAEASAWLAAGLIFGAALMWRGSELLRFLAFAAASVAFTIPALHAGRAWVRRARVIDLVHAAAASGLHAALGSARLFTSGGRGAAGSTAPGGTLRVVRPVLVGTLLALVPLVVFGALFMSADRVFAQIVGDFVRIDLQRLASHLALAAVLSWLACGYLTGFASGTRLDGLLDLRWERPSFRVAEVAVALGLVDLLFLAFVTVQFRYLFGGAEWVEVTPGLTYAAYAREGFFQLVTATALGIPWLLTADYLLAERGEGAQRIFRTLAGAQLLLLLAIEVSAVERLRTYLAAYGLTESRFVAMAVLGWLALLLLWFGATVLRGRRTPFALGALVSGFALVLLLQVGNPTAYAARSHLDRVEAPAPGSDAAGSSVDVRYLASLGSDAAPILVDRIDEVGQDGRCEIAQRLLSRWGPDRVWDWRSWNLADWRARKAVAARAPALRRVVGDGSCE